MNTSERYLIWSNEHRAWWGHDFNGYVKSVDTAGRYTLADAIEICEKASWGSVLVPNETMVPASAIPKQL